jgi:hypothetical protein
VAGPTAWTGEATAAALSAALGTTVTYGGDDLVAWRSPAEPRTDPGGSP